MFWVMNYYYHGIPDWHWFYPFHYAPFLSDLLDIIDDYTAPSFQLHEPLPMLLQLLILLPPSDRYLLPICMRKTVYDRLGSYFPDTVQIDITGKQKENEGIVLLPPSVDIRAIMEVFREYEKDFTVAEQKRNKFGRLFRYAMHPRSKLYPFYSYYGNIMECPVEVTQLNIPS
jgi:5'-3' exonuclease